MADVLHLLRVTIEAKSPLSSASGDSDNFDVALNRDANGLPEIAASTIQGVLRHLHRDRFGPEATNGLFGFAEGKEGAVARLFFSFGRVHDSNGRAVSGLRLDEAPDAFADELLRMLSVEAPVAREHVALDHRHVSAGRAKFERIAAPRGTRFSFEIAMWSDKIAEHDDRAALLRLLSLVRQPDFRLGGAARRGYGRIGLIAAGHLALPLSDPVAIRRVRERPASDLDGFAQIDIARDLTPSGDRATAITFMLRPVGLWRCGSTGLAMRTGQHELRDAGAIHSDRGGPDLREKDVDAASVREPWIDWSGGTGVWREPRRVPDPSGPTDRRARASLSVSVAGSAIKGPLAHRTLFHWNRLQAGEPRMLDPASVPERDPAELRAAVARIAATRLGDASGGDIAMRWDVRPAELEELLGSAKERDDRSAAAGRTSPAGRAARLIVEDTTVEAGPDDVVALDHNSLDRFTGGVRNRLLYSEEAIMGGAIEVTITVLPRLDDEGRTRPTDAWPEPVRRAFCHALRDLCEGRLALGAKSLGFGTALGAPAFSGGGAAAWERSWSETGAPTGRGGPT